MAFKRVTLESLRCAIRWRVGVENVKRHEPGDISAAINRAVQRFREAVSSTGCPYFLARADVTIGAGVAAGLPYQTLNLQSFAQTCIRVYGLEIIVDGRTIVLTPVPFDARNDYHSSESDRGVPLAWTHLDADTLAVFPASSVSYPGRIWYLPPHVDVSNNADQIEVLTSGDEWIIREVAIQLLERDTRPELIGVMMQERDTVLAEMLSSLNKLQHAGPIVRRDTRRAKAYQWARSKLLR
jgi:hypothetical protein